MSYNPVADIMVLSSFV